MTKYGLAEEIGLEPILSASKADVLTYYTIPQYQKYLLHFVDELTLTCAYISVPYPVNALTGNDCVVNKLLFILEEMRKSWENRFGGYLLCILLSRFTVSLYYTFI